MSITYCHNCNKNIDTDFDATHIEDCKGEDGLENLKHSIVITQKGGLVIKIKSFILNIILYPFIKFVVIKDK